MIRSDRFKYVVFRSCEPLAFDLVNDPDEQINIADKPEFANDLEPLRKAVLDGFSFDEAESKRLEQSSGLKKQFPAKFEPVTPNQVVLGDGRLVEADTPLYHPEILSNDLSRDLSDWAENK